MKIKAIVAITNDNAIGLDDEILFNIKPDQQRFKELTLGQICAMGTNTYFSLPKFAQPLPMRTSAILSRSKKMSDLGTIEIADDYKESTHVFMYNDPNSLLAKARGFKGDLWIIGGEQIYKLFMPVLDEIELTQIFSDKKGNRFFPEFKDKFELTAQSEIMFDEKNDVEFQYQTWTRKIKKESHSSEEE